jgi:hypothetical protein
VISVLAPVWAAAVVAAPLLPAVAARQPLPLQAPAVMAAARRRQRRRPLLLRRLSGPRGLLRA